MAAACEVKAKVEVQAAPARQGCAVPVEPSTLGLRPRNAPTLAEVAEAAGEHAHVLRDGEGGGWSTGHAQRRRRPATNTHPTRRCVRWVLPCCRRSRTLQRPPSTVAARGGPAVSSFADSPSSCPGKHQLALSPACPASSSPRRSSISPPSPLRPLALSNSPPTSTRQVRSIPVVWATNCHGVLEPNDPPGPNKCLIKAEFSATRSSYKALPAPDRWPLCFGCPVSPSSRLHLQAIVRDADPTDPLTSFRPPQLPDSFNPTVNRLNLWDLRSQS
jgi:hypothetical protein